MAESIGNCSVCDQPMVEHRFTRHYVRTCDTAGCSLRWAPQGYREIATDSPLDNSPLIEEEKGREGNRKE